MVDRCWSRSVEGFVWSNHRYSACLHSQGCVEVADSNHSVKCPVWGCLGLLWTEQHEVAC